jgi:hypothetical protein
VLVDRPVQIGLPASNLDVSFIGKPPVAGNMPSQPCRLDELGSKPLDPPVHRDVIDRDATFGQELLDIPVRQALAQVPADCDRDHLPGEPEASKH